MNYLCKRCTIVTEITASLLPKVLHCCYRKHCTFIYRNYCILSYRYQYPIIALTGPRQSGKTTLLKEMFSDYRYVNLENPDTRNFAETDPQSFLNQYGKYVIFDEVQRVPHLFSYIQSIVDDSRIMGQFIFFRVRKTFI